MELKILLDHVWQLDNKEKEIILTTTDEAWANQISGAVYEILFLEDLVKCALNYMRTKRRRPFPNPALSQITIRHD